VIRISRAAAVLLAAVMLLDLGAVIGTLAVLDLDPLAALAAGRNHAKVVIIVGPVGGYTDFYRSEANKAAAVARQLSDDVETLYSPDATWSAARKAMQGASIVVYLGHGNGWPSPYRDRLYRPTQDGLGLNPVAGVDDSTHQYFGESFIAREVHLAPGAVVVLSHLCYASGNPEPGGPEPSVAVARQRADNYAAGWIAAGASGVIAEAHAGPAYYVRGLLRGRGSLDRMWRDAPTFHGNVVAFDSARRPGVTVLLDPDEARRGYNRSLAMAGSIQLSDLLRAEPAAGSAAETSGSSSAPPSLTGLGVRFGTPRLTGTPVAGTMATLTLPADARTRRILPTDLKLGTRWDPVDVADTPPSAANVPLPPAPTPSAGPAGVPPPNAGQVAESSVTPGEVPAAIDGLGAGPRPTDLTVPSLVAGDPPQVDLVEREVEAAVVTTAPTVTSRTGPTVAVSVPSRPGLYRLVTTLHDGDGMAFDADSQELIPALIVHVTGSLWATYGSPDSVVLEVSRPAVIRLRVANSGTVSWGARPKEDLVEQDVGPAGLAPAVVARWVSLDDSPPSTERTVTAGIGWAFVDPGRTTTIELIVTAPTVPGRYLLLFDIRTADGVSLASIGVPPGITRATVATAAVSQSQSPSRTPSLEPGGESPDTMTPTTAPGPRP